MSKRSKRVAGGAIVLAAFAVGLVTVNLSTEPDKTRAGDGDPLPDSVAIVFVLDGSANVVGPGLRDYFTLAKEGVAEFLSLPGIPLDETLEVAAIQFAELPETGPGPRYYQDGVHWIGLTAINETNINNVIAKVEGMKHCSHATASLLEMGLREATGLLTGCTASDKHIILLSSGEYRLPWPYPPACYTYPDTDCDCTNDPPEEDDNGNRACQIRDFADQARDEGIWVSALHIGPEWADGDNEDAYAYDSCTVPEDSDWPPARPNRGMLLREITNADACPLHTHDEGGQSVDDPVGKFSRIHPRICLGCGIEDWRPPKATDISSTLATWMCEWGYGHNTDDDYLHGDPDKPLLSPCDNCPDLTNPRQRDCNRDGIGDLCQQGDPYTLCMDSDGDGVCNSMDTCEGGDDCLAADWLEAWDCERYDTCGCDCDHDGLADACQQAVALAAETLPWGDGTDVDLSGVADYCEDTAHSVECSGVPEDCNADQETGYAESFNELPEGTGPQHGAWVHSKDEHFDASFAIEDIDAGPGQDHALVMNPVDGTGHWMATGPAITLPLWACDPDLPWCYDGVDPDRWGAYVVSMELMITSAASEATTDLYLFSACESGQSRTERVHLKFITMTTDPALGHLLVKSSDPPEGLEQPVPGFYKYAEYPEGNWFTLHILINLARNYGLHGDACDWRPKEDTKVMTAWVVDGEGQHRNSLGFNELNETAFTSKGIQIAIETHVTNTVMLNAISVYALTICEWNQYLIPCPAEEDLECACTWREQECGVGHHNCWHCAEECGNGIIDEGEECDLGGLNGPKCGCTADCQIDDQPDWYCGDGVRNCLEGCDLGIYNGEGCGCTADCMIDETPEFWCGDGIVNCGEACDPEDTDDPLGCTDTCVRPPT